MVLQQRFRSKLLAALRAKSWSQTKLADEMGVTPQYVHKYLSGISTPGLDVVERFAAALGTDDPSDLINEKDTAENFLPIG